MGLILYIVATILFLPLTAINFLIVLWKNPNLKTINAYFFEGAIDLDRFGNREFRTLWNVLLRKKGGYKFGNENETISSCLGKNKRDKTLSFLGKALCWILDSLDKNHCKKSIK
jgi:hypothetical protein